MSDINVSRARSAGFIPQVWANEGLRVLRASLNVGRLIRRDTDYVPASVGETITVPYPGTFGAPKKTATAGVTAQVPQGGASVAVTLNTHRTVDFLIQDVARAQGSPAILESYVRPAVVAIAEAIEADIIAQAMQLTNNNGSAGTDITAAQLRTAMRKLSDRRIPKQERFVVMSPKDVAAALGDTALASFFAFSQAQSIREGALGRDIYGFTPYESQMCPATCVQRLTFSGGSNGETFRLIFNGIVTADIAYNSTGATLATNIQTALAALVDPITMTGLVAAAVSSGTIIDVTFSGAALRYNSALTFTVQDVAGTAYAGTCTVANQGTVTTTNFALHPEALILAFRPFPDIPPETGVTPVQIMDEESGLALRLIYTYDMSNRSVRVGFDALYGVNTLRQAAGERLIC